MSPVEAQADGRVRKAPPSLNELRDRREAILQLARRHGAREIRVFGSVARGDAGKGSDVDFLVDMEAGRSLLDLGGFLMDLLSLVARWTSSPWLVCVHACGHGCCRKQ